jgi:ribosomal-protein-alanine N-acetyltransferase
MNAKEREWRLTVDGGFIELLVVPPEAEILNIEVEPHRRRRGIGAALLQAAIRRCRQAGVSRLFLEVRESNYAAIRLYQRAGFERVGRRKGYYQNPVEDAVLFSLTLPLESPSGLC